MKRRLFSKSLLIAKSLWDRRIGRVTSFFNAPELVLTQLPFRPKYRKIVELLLYLAHQKPGVDHYAASKYVYLADREHFNLYGRPVTYDTYGAMPWGPVALKTYELLKQERGTMRAAGIDELPFETTKIEKHILIKEPRRAVDLDLFSETDIEIFDWVLREFGHLTMGQLHDLTMRHPGYRRAWANKPQGANLAAIDYEDILENENKEALIADLAPIARRM